MERIYGVILKNSLEVKIMMKVALTGQYLKLSGFITSFHDENSNWVRELFDPRNYRNLLKNNDYCYALWHSTVYGYHYSLIKHSPDTETRDGYVMIIICTGEYVIRDGGSVMRAFSDLENILLCGHYLSIQDMKDRSNDRVNEVCTSIEQYKREPRVSKFSIRGGNGYRLYNDESLVDFLSSIEQVCEGYEHVFLLSNDSNLEGNFSKITTNLKKSYSITYPYGVIINKSNPVFQGDSLIIKYTNNGYKTEEREVKVDGVSNNYMRYTENSNIEIKNALDAHIQFKRIIRLVCNNKEISSFKLEYKGKSQEYPKLKDKDFVFDDSELANGLKIKIRADGYEDCEITIRRDDVISGRVEFTLKPLVDDLRVTLLVNKQPITDILKIEQTNKLYRALKEAHNSNNYFILDNINREKRINRKVVVGGMASFLVIILGCCIWFLYFLPELNCNIVNENEKQHNENEKQHNERVDYGTTVSESPVVQNENRINDVFIDLVYMKKNDKWKFSELKSDLYKNLFNCIIECKIDSIIKPQEPWFPSNNNFANNYWNEFVKILINKMDSTKVKTAIQGSCNSEEGVIDLKKLVSALVSSNNTANTSQAKIIKQVDNKPQQGGSGRSSSH